MMSFDLGHPAFACHDLEASLAFYAKLGITESFRLHHEDGRLMLVYCHVGGDRFIELFPNGPEPVDKRVQSFMHLCLTTEDIEFAVDFLRGQGIEITREIKVGLDHNKQAWIRDPDGNDIELMQLSKDSPQWKIANGLPPSI
jgi:lactoylglutathione lyase